MRLQKWIAKLGIASRREAERWIEKGRLQVNGSYAIQPGYKIDPEKDHITLDGRPLKAAPAPHVYWLFHKPKGTLTSRASQGDVPTIYELPALAKIGFLVSPIGRLDKDTEGLIVLSNDGDLVHRMTHPSFEVPRHYYAYIEGRLSPESVRSLRKGITLEDGPVAGIEISYSHGQKTGTGKQGSWYRVTVKEGRNRLVRRLFEHFEHRVLRLVRYGMGPLRLPDQLKPGTYRQLDPNEIRQLKKTVDLA